MRIPLDRLIDGAVHALTANVVPHVSDRFARGQVWSVIDILHNLRERIDWKAGPLEDEVLSAVSTLQSVGTLLRAAGHEDLAERFPALPDAPAAERAIAARAAIVTALTLLATLPTDIATPMYAAINGHFAMNALRDLQTFKPSLLQEISQG